MTSALSPSRCRLRYWRACGPHDCSISAGLRPTGSLSGSGAGALVIFVSCRSLSASRPPNVARVTLVTFLTQSSHTQEVQDFLYRKLGATTSQTSQPMTHLLDAEQPPWQLRLSPPPVTVRPEQLCTGNPHPASVPLGRRRAAAVGERTTRGEGWTVPLWAHAPRDFRATPTAVP